MKITWLYRLTPLSMATEWHGMTMIGPMPVRVAMTEDGSRVVLRAFTPCCASPLDISHDWEGYSCENCDRPYPVENAYAATASHRAVVRSQGLLDALDFWDVDPLTATILEAETRASLAALTVPAVKGSGTKATVDPELVDRVCLVLAREWVHDGR